MSETTQAENESCRVFRSDWTDKWGWYCDLCETFAPATRDLADAERGRDEHTCEARA